MKENQPAGSVGYRQPRHIQHTARTHRGINDTANVHTDNHTYARRRQRRRWNLHLLLRQNINSARLALPTTIHVPYGENLPQPNSESQRRKEQCHI